MSCAAEQVNDERIMGLDCQAMGFLSAPLQPIPDLSLPPGISKAEQAPLAITPWKQQRRQELQRLIFMLKTCHLVLARLNLFWSPVRETGGGFSWNPFSHGFHMCDISAQLDMAYLCHCQLHAASVLLAHEHRRIKQAAVLFMEAWLYKCLANASFWQ